MRSLRKRNKDETGSYYRCVQNLANEKFWGLSLIWVPWTTLCPAPSEKDKILFPADIPQTRKGWACLVLDTYTDGTVNPANIVSGNNIFGHRWVLVGAGYRAIGFYFDKTIGTPISLTINAQNCISAGPRGGQWLDFDGRKPNGGIHMVTIQ